jgi:hypothetical protein
VSDEAPTVTTVADALARAAAGELLGPLDLMLILHISEATFYRRKARGEFKRFEVRPPIGSHCYAGTLVHRYVSGEAVFEPTFGAKRGAR